MEHINRYNPHKQKVFGVPNDLTVYRGPKTKMFENIALK